MAENFNMDGLIPVEDVYNPKDYRRAPRKKAEAAKEKKSAVEPLLSIAEAAKIVGVSRKRIDNAINSGELPFYSIGVVARKIRQSDLEAWLASKRTTITAGRYT